METIKIGSPVWIYDNSRRVYTDPTPAEKKAGRIWGNIIWRERWRKHIIASETSRSWITDSGAKIPKKIESSGVVFSESELDDRSFANSHAHLISNIVGSLTHTNEQISQLKKIAEIIGYDAEQKGQNE